MVENIIKLNYITRKKIAEMCVVLLPRVGYARVTRSGIVILKRSKWSLCRRRIPVTDLIIKYIPLQIAKLICKKKDRAVYVSLFDNQIVTIVSLTKYTPSFDLFEYIWKEYSRICIISEPEEEVVDFKESISMKFRNYNINNSLGSMRSLESKYRLSERVSKLKTRLKDRIEITIPLFNLQFSMR